MSDNEKSLGRREFVALICGALPAALCGLAIGQPGVNVQGFQPIPDRQLEFAMLGLLIGGLAGLASAIFVPRQKERDHTMYSFWASSAGFGSAFALALFFLLRGGGLMDGVASFVVGALFGAIAGLVLALVGQVMGLMR